MTLLAAGARAGDSCATARRREGTSTLGLWLPLAFARLIQAVEGLFGKPPKTSAIVAGFALPELAKALKADERAGEKERLASWIADLKERFDGGQEDRHKATNQCG